MATPLISVRAMRTIMNNTSRDRKLNILTFPTHERYEENLCKTGHNFYSIRYGKSWDEEYAPIPSNYHIIDELPDYVDIDIILNHTTCDRLLQSQAQYLQSGGDHVLGRCAAPMIRHCHVLPDLVNQPESLQAYKKLECYGIDKNSFISSYSAKVWGYEGADVVEHGIDTEFWSPADVERQEVALSVVNDWINRDWCCGFNLWESVVRFGQRDQMPVMVLGKTPGFSKPAKDKAELREYYRRAGVFINTSLISPVPSVLMEAMSCGCPVVSTNNCMIPEIIEHGVNGFMSNDPDELREYAQILLKDKELACKMGNEARKTILERFSLERFISNWNDLFYKTIGEFK